MYKLNVLGFLASVFLFTHHPIYASTLAETEKMLSDTSKKLATLEAKYEALADVVHILVKYGNNLDGLSSLCYASKKGDIEAVTTLIENGADVKTQSWVINCNDDERQSTNPLSEAIISNNIETVKKLLSLGALPEYAVYRNFRENPLMLAVKYGSLEMINALNNEDVNYTYCGISLLAYAIICQKHDLIIALVEAGANVNELIENCCSPLDHASCLIYEKNPRNLEIVRFLVEHGATRKDVHYDLNCRVISAYLESVGK